MKTVIYHSADYDGIFCREIAKHFLGEKDVNYIGWNFGDAPLDLKGVQPTDHIIVMDLPLDAPFGLKMHPRAGDNDATGFPDTLVWIDHHASTIASHPKNIPGYRIDGVAACRLAWQWFSHRESEDVPADWKRELMPSKADYVNRDVNEPLAVRLAGEYDIWDKRDPQADTFQYALRVKEITPDAWGKLLDTSCDNVLQTQESQIMVQTLMEAGRAAQSYAKQENESLVTHRSYMTEWEGLKFLTVNAPRCNSLTFEAKDVPDTGHDALLAYCFNGKVWTVSLYHAKHRTDLDLSLIAVKHGGGGHRGACGFTCDKLPFL